MATKINIKYGEKSNLSSLTQSDGTLYVATKENDRAELYVDLNDKRYLISESLQTDDSLNSDSINPIQNKVVSDTFSIQKGKIENLETAIRDKANQSTVSDLSASLITEIANRTNEDALLNTEIGNIKNNINNLNTNINNNASNLENLSSAISSHIKITDNINAIGQANISIFGHVKLSDEVNSTNNVSKGIAATPAALNTVKTNAEDALNNYKTEANSKFATINSLNEEKTLRENLTNSLQTHISDAEEMYIYIGDETLTNTNLPINASTLEGKTLAEVISMATVESSDAGTVGFSTDTITTGTTVTLTDVSNGSYLLPRTNIDNVVGLRTELNKIPTNPVTFATGTSAPEEKIGVIWFDGPTSGKYTIKIWNGVTWEVMNSWQ